MDKFMDVCRGILNPSTNLEEFEVIRSTFGLRNREVPFLNDISAEEYFWKFLLPNKACLIGERLTRDWVARKDWVDENGKPNWKHLRERYGQATVPVANCSKVEYGSHVKTEMRMAEYLDYWQGDIVSRSRQNVASNERNILYLKDWHFSREFKESPVYEVAAPFRSDWLNEYWDATDTDDYRFVYMGPKGTWTPFHADVFRSYSWSTNVCGRKRWLLFPPGDEAAFRDRFGAFPLDVTSEELQDGKRFPAADSATQPIVVIQEAGQTIFVPSGWHHQVENLEDTVSINHNWGNACNIVYLWNGLKDDLKEVEKAISDCRSMDGYHTHCQILLRAHSGLNFHGFLMLIQTISAPRLAKMECFLRATAAEKMSAAAGSGAAASTPQLDALPTCCGASDAGFSYNSHHWNLFDLACVRLVLRDMLAQPLSLCFTAEQHASIAEATRMLAEITRATTLFCNLHAKLQDSRA